MTEFINIATFCAILGAGFICAFLVISGVLRWLAKDDSKNARLNIASWMAFIIICIVFLVHNGEVLGNFFMDGGHNTDFTYICIYASKLLVKLMLLIFLVSYLAIFAYKISDIIKHTVFGDKYGFRKKRWHGNIEDEYKAFAAFITVGLIIVFIIAPLFVVDLSDKLETGEQGAAYEEKKTEDTAKAEGMLDLWQEGVKDIVKLATNSANGSAKSDSFYNTVIAYAFLYIIILGIGYAAVKILYTIIADNFKPHENIIDKYSSPIGLLSVGLAMLWSIRKVDLFNDNSSDKEMLMPEMIGEFIKSFMTIAIIVALSILTLEIIRLLLDTSESLIREEAKYLFVSLIGQVSMLLLDFLYFVYKAICNVLNLQDNQDMEKINEELRRGILQTMYEQLEKYKKYKMTFRCFDGSLTPKNPSSK